MNGYTLLADVSLARRMEAALAYEGTAYVTGWQRMDPSAGATAEPLAGGALLFTGIDSPVTQAVGLGMDDPLTSPDFEHLLSFFEDRGATPRVSVCPLADPSLIAGLGDRGFRVEEFESALVRPLVAGEELAPLPPDVEIHRVGREDEQAWVAVMTQAWLLDMPGTPVGPGDTGPDKTDQGLAAVPLYIPGVECFLATVGGEPAGGGALSAHDGIGTLFADATLAAFRRRGVQTALLGTRLARAAEQGCDLAAAGAAPGGVSQRNFERLGFRVAYTALMMMRPGASV